MVKRTVLKMLGFGVLGPFWHKKAQNYPIVRSKTNYIIEGSTENKSF